MTAFRISADLPLVAGETVLCARRDVQVGSALSLPSYRLFFTLPPLLEVGLLVTDRRVVLHGLCLRLLSQVTSLWFGGDDVARERLESVSVGNAPLLGEYLEVHSIEPVDHWFRSRRLRLRLFVRGAREVAEIIERHLHGAT